MSHTISQQFVSLFAYLSELARARNTGATVKETASYGALAMLLNDVGQGLKPNVRCFMGLRNQGAGMPDGGLFTASQYERGAGQPAAGQLPERGCVEVKSAAADVAQIAQTEQVSRYLQKYRQVLVTNYRDFLLLALDAQNRPVTLERYRLAASEAEFWAARPEDLAREHGPRLADYLRRVMLQAAEIATPESVAWFLASYAREAKARVERADVPALDALRAALEEALGIRFEGDKGQRFFRSTLVQTLFYGVFSAWVLWAQEQESFESRLQAARADAERPPEGGTQNSFDWKTAARAGAEMPLEGGTQNSFDWKTAAWKLRVPVIRALFEQLAVPSKLQKLDLVEVLGWTAGVLNRVNRAEFFRRFDEAQAVQYFYEPFLQAFDPELRKELGVWYTPPEIVKYMVARVDTALREELGIAEGLADERVFVLDPCCGTGAYLVAVLERIHESLTAWGEGDALAAHALRAAAQQRIFGFEILPAPFVVAHLQLGLLLQRLGAALGDAETDRAAIYLTNALTGWQPAAGPKKELLFPEMAEERDQASAVKQHKPILVVLGNPPYNGYAGLAVDEERALTDAYRLTKHAPAPQGQGLNDLYIRFYRMAERRITEQTGRGVVCFISNYSWLDGLSFTGMRERYLEIFDRIQIDCLNGDKYKTGKLTPDGQPDPSVFSTAQNREGIQVGTAIALLVKKDAPAPAAVRFRHWWGKEKRAELLASLATETNDYTELAPALELGLPFVPAQADAAYTSWPLLPELLPVSFPGVKTSRDDVVVDIDRERLERRMLQYFDPNISHAEMKRIAPSAMKDGGRFQAQATRETLLKRGFLPENIVRYCYRPFDVRWLYWEPETKLLDEKRAEYFPQVFGSNLYLVSQQKPRREWSPPQVIKSLGCLDLMDRGASCIPLYLRPVGQKRLFDAPANVAGPAPNLSERARKYLATLGVDAETLFYHALAVLHAPAYRQENAGALRQDWPRIPLPREAEMLRKSAQLGRYAARLLDTETAVEGVTAGVPFAPLASIAVLGKTDGGAFAPADWRVAAGWGHAGQNGVTMPGKGRVTARGYTEQETAQLQAAGAGALLGAQTGDVWLNGAAYWRNVPQSVWEYTAGGYQVLKKWLSYREHALLQRPLNPDEARQFMRIARRIAALLLLEPQLNDNYQAVIL